jgi:hypothetical protein
MHDREPPMNVILAGFFISNGAARSFISLTYSHIRLGYSLLQQFWEVVLASVLVSTQSRRLPKWLCHGSSCRYEGKHSYLRG